MNVRDRSPQTPVKLILNASPDAELLKNRAQMLNDAGYYTSSAQTSEEVVQLAAQMHCDVALICHSFDVIQQSSIQQRLREISPDIMVVFVKQEMDGNHRFLVSRIREALRSSA